MTMVTTTLFKIIQSELIKLGRNEFEGTEKQTSLFDFGTFDFFKNDLQFTSKLFSYDDDIKLIVNWLFNDFSLDVAEHDQHFKKMFIYKFVNRQIQKQTIESFKYDLSYVFLSKKDYINRIYKDADKYIHRLNIAENNANSESKTNGTDNTITTSKSNSSNQDNSTSKTDSNSVDRKATSNIPNSTLSFDLDSDTFNNPSTADAGKNKSLSNTVNAGENIAISTSENKNEGNKSDESTSSSHDDSMNKSYTLDDIFKYNNVFENIMIDFDRKCFLQIW